MRMLITFCGFALVLASLPVSATVLGLNQIETPDIQPPGVLAITYQAQNKALGNSQQLQLELGLSRRFEMAVFRGFEPGSIVVGAEYALVQQKEFLLTVGTLGLQHRAKTQPFIEGGYYHNSDFFFVAGVQRQNSANLPVAGAAYQIAPVMRLQSDYVGGANNYSTFGVAFTLTPTVTVNPAIYIANHRPHKTYGYGVVTWQVKVW